jgi:FkbM family methyltransferase
LVKWRKVAAFGAGMLGYEAFPKYLTDGRAHAIRLRNLFQRCKIERVLDIGANRGQFHDFLRVDVEFEGLIHSFEPDPMLVEHLERRAANDPRWRVSSIALGAKRESRVFSRMVHTAYNSFLNPIEGNDPNNSVTAQFDVEIRPLDDMLPDLKDLSRTFIKIDTQGFDLQVLEGGPRAFAAAPLVQTEVSFRPIYKESPPWSQSMQAFERAGFLFADMFQINGPAAGAAWEADLLMIKPEFA